MKQLLAGDAKSTLQELLQEKYNEGPDYVLEQEEGPAHARIFTVSVQFQGKISGQRAGIQQKRGRAESCPGPPCTTWNNRADTARNVGLAAGACFMPFVIPVFIPHQGCPHTCHILQSARISGRTEAVRSHPPRCGISSHYGWPGARRGVPKESRWLFTAAVLPA